MIKNYVGDRITQLRMEKNISERKMSLDLGHSEGYINGISSGRISPSMGEFFYICEYLDTTPREFFTEDSQLTADQKRIISYALKLESKDLELILEIMKRLVN